MKMNVVERAPSEKVESCLQVFASPNFEEDDMAFEDPSLVLQADRELFEVLFMQYQDKILRYLYRLVRDIEDAHDLTQKTFMRAWEKLPTLKDKSRFLPWLYKIARNIACDYWRSEKNSLLLSWEDLSEQQSIISISGPEEVIEVAEIISLALAEMTPKYRACLLLYAVYGFTKQEIAKLLGISQASVTTYYCSAKRQFRQAYDRLKRELFIADLNCNEFEGETDLSA